MKGTVAAAFAACSLLTGAVSIRVETSARVQGGAAENVQPIAGEWRSSEQFDDRPRATLAVQDGAGRLTGTLTLLGLTNGDDDRAALQVPFREAAWDGTTLSFETVLPDGEPTTRWTLRVTAPDKGTLGPLADDGRPEEGGPTWEMSRR
jgi:hypothetical protein